MLRFPKTARAVAAEIKMAYEAAGYNAQSLSLKLGQPHNYIWRICSLEKLVWAHELPAICKACGITATTLMARVERRLK